eukprot:167481_1
MNNRQPNPFNSVQPFGGTNNVDQFNLNQFMNQSGFNNTHNLHSTSNGGGTNNAPNPQFGLLNGHSNNNTLTSLNQNSTDLLGTLMNVTNNTNTNNSSTNNSNDNPNPTAQNTNSSNHNANNNTNQNGFPSNNPLGSAMSNADIETILHLQKQTDQFHEHLSKFINTHLPSLPDTMELMDKLSYDFNQNTVSAATANNSENNTNNTNHNNRNRGNNLPRLEAHEESMIETLNRDVLHWKSKAIALTEEKKALEAQNKELQRKLSQMENQLIGTRNVALNGGGPRLDSIEFVKHEGTADGINYKHTKGVDRLKKSIRSQYDTSKWKIAGDEALYVYFDSILAFLNENEENVVIPQILMPKRGRNPMDVDNEDENYRLISQSECLEKYRIVNDVRVPVLNGEHGVRCLMDIPQHTVVGQYCGVEYLESEFHNAFIGTRENVEKNIYAFTLMVGGHRSGSESPQGNTPTPTKKIVIDAHGFHMNAPNGTKPLLLYINDCRADISAKHKTQDDEKHENVMFCKVSLNGWPSIFVITKRVAKKGEQLLGFYGNDYWDAVQEKELQETIRNRNRNLIDRNIIQG